MKNEPRLAGAVLPGLEPDWDFWKRMLRGDIGEYAPDVDLEGFRALVQGVREDCLKWSERR